jgi:hypothetical protein
MRERDALKAEIVKVKAAAKTYGEKAGSASAWIDLRADTLRGEMAKNPDFRRMSVEQLGQRAIEQAAREWRTARAAEAATIDADAARIRTLIADAAARAERIAVPDPDALDEETTRRLTGEGRLIFIENRRTTRELQLLRLTFMYQGAPVSTRLDALEAAQAKQDWLAASFLDDLIEADVRRLPETAKERERFAQLRQARVPDLAATRAEMEQELAQATVATQAMATREALAGKAAEGQPITDADILTMQRVGRAERAARETTVAS